MTEEKHALMETAAFTAQIQEDVVAQQLAVTATDSAWDGQPAIHLRDATA